MRFTFRALSKRLGVTLFSAALLAIGIGGGALLFSAFESVWLRTLPVRHPEQLVRMVQRLPGNFFPGQEESAGLGNFLPLADRPPRD